MSAQATKHTVYLNIYDLGTVDNSALYALGLGLYHTGVEVHQTGLIKIIFYNKNFHLVVTAPFVIHPSKPETPYFVNKSYWDRQSSH